MHYLNANYVSLIIQNGLAKKVILASPVTKNSEKKKTLIIWLHALAKV
jgi:hypothetical protein